MNSMGTDQILDLFNSNTLTDKPNSETNSNTKNILENMEELWDEKQYEEFDVSNFLKSL